MTEQQQPIDTTSSPATQESDVVDGDLIGTDDLWNIHSYVNEYIRFSDTKAASIIAWTSALIGLLIANDNHHLFTHTSLTLTDIDWAMTGMAILSLFSLLFLSAGFLMAVSVLHPRLGSGQSRETVPHEKDLGVIYWGNVVEHGSCREYANRLSTFGVQSMRDQIGCHLFDLSTICSRKYDRTASAVWVAVAGSILASLTVVLSK